MSGISRIFGYHPLEFDEYISPDGITYRFNNVTDRFSLGRTGDGLPPIDYITERGPYQAGETPLNLIVNSRLITLQHIRKATNREDYYTNRNDILNKLRPNRQEVGSFQPGVLRKILPDGSYRDITVFIQDGLVFPNNTDVWRETTVVEVVRFIAHDPIYYDPDENIVSYAVGSDTDELSFAITFPIEFGLKSTVEAFNIEYDGTWISYPVIILNGQMSDPEIRNISTNKMLKLNYDIDADVSVTIDLSYGSKSVVDNQGNNLIGYLDENSDLTEFAINPEPVVEDGINSFGVSALNRDANAQFIVRYFTRYIGV